MDYLTKFERHALCAIFSETPEFASVLGQQLENASVVNRENTGGGFYTTVSIPIEIPSIKGPRLLSEETYAQVEGLEHGIGFVLFLENGYLHILEGYALAPEDTSSLDFSDLNFTILNSPADLI
ncbi:MAG: hypothetical protein Pars2KO_00900 [Parasphingorhabdus sp.]